MASKSDRKLELLPYDGLPHCAISSFSSFINFPPVPGVAIAGSIVPLSDSIVTLGVTLDSNLSFRHHVSKVRRSAH